MEVRTINFLSNCCCFTQSSNKKREGEGERQREEKNKAVCFQNVFLIIYIYRLKYVKFLFQLYTLGIYLYTNSEAVYTYEKVRRGSVCGLYYYCCVYLNTSIYSSIYIHTYICLMLLRAPNL